MQALLAHINGVVQSSEDYIEALRAEVHSRENELLSLYLTQFPRAGREHVVAGVFQLAEVIDEAEVEAAAGVMGAAEV